MKRIVLIGVIVAALCLWIAGCNKTVPASEPLEDDAAQNEDILVEAEEDACVFSTVDDLLAYIWEVRNRDLQEHRAEVNHIAELSVLIMPAGAYDGYALHQVEVVPECVIYTFNPIGETFTEDTGITVTTYRNSEATLASVCGPLGIEPNEMGYAYSESDRTILFTKDGTVISIRVPESMNSYETLLGMCTMSKMQID